MFAVALWSLLLTGSPSIFIQARRLNRQDGSQALRLSKQDEPGSGGMICCCKAGPCKEKDDSGEEEKRYYDSELDQCCKLKQQGLGGKCPRFSGYSLLYPDGCKPTTVSATPKSTTTPAATTTTTSV